MTNRQLDMLRDQSGHKPQFSLQKREARLTTGTSHLIAWAESFLLVPQEDRFFHTIQVRMEKLGLTLTLKATGATVVAQEQPGPASKVLGPNELEEAVWDLLRPYGDILGEYNVGDSLHRAIMDFLEKRYGGGTRHG